MLTDGIRLGLERLGLPSRSIRLLKSTFKFYRLLTGHLRALPDFIIIGARRCGTTSLYHYLTQHPQVIPALTKEVHYFTANYDKGLDWYRSYFPMLLHKQLCQLMRGDVVITGEATPSYIYDPLIAQRIFQVKPDVKLIALLRNPVDAVYSAYHFGLKVGTYTAESMPFAETISNELEQLKTHDGEAASLTNGQAQARRRGWLWHGLYVEHLKPWLAQFPREQLLIIISEAFFSDPHKTFQEVLEFLSLRPYRLKSYDKLNANVYAQMDAGLREQLTEYYAPYNRQLSQLLGIDVNWNETSSVCLQAESSGSGL